MLLTGGLKFNQDGSYYGTYYVCLAPKSEMYFAGSDLAPYI